MSQAAEELRFDPSPSFVASAYRGASAVRAEDNFHAHYFGAALGACADLYARVGDFYAQDAQRKALQAATLHAIEAGGNEIAVLAAHVAARIVDCHLATMERLGIRYELLAHESDILRLHFWDRAFELLKESGAIRLESEGKNAGCWVMPGLSEEGKVIVRSDGTVAYRYASAAAGDSQSDAATARHPRSPSACG